MRDWVEYMTFDGVSPMADQRRANGQEEPWKVQFFGIGNEAWGCGGNMRPEYYADEFRKFNTYLYNYGDNKLFRIASGASDNDYNWTRTLMDRIGRRMDGIAVHHYSVAGTWAHKGSALDFNEDEWAASMKSSWWMDELITNHSAIMDEFDPEKKIWLIVDEWGNWHDVEEGTNPGFLYQQNSVRDAVVAGMILNIFNNHSDRVRMANIAQMVNVLQSVILTEGTAMVKTPTYHVFDMYKDHQNATRVDASEIDVPAYVHGDITIPAVTSSVSKKEDGTLLVTFSNADPNASQKVMIDVRGKYVGAAEGLVLTGEAMNSANTFDAPETVRPVPFTDFVLEDSVIKAELPARSVVSLTIR